MALTIANGGGGGCGSSRGGILYSNPTKHHFTSLPIKRHLLFPLSTRTTTTTLHIVSAKKFSSRTGRLDGKNRRSNTTTKDQDENQQRNDLVDNKFNSIEGGGGVGSFEDGVVAAAAADGYVLPELPGDKPDFWEGPQWDAFGFFVQYLWAFGIVFALIACGVAVATYNEGATDFKETPAYKESIQSRELLEEPDASTSDVFESNPTEVAPSLE
ncbi:uncharacterized protein LOC126702151 [Quercus robur]|uniref:uncharacterized protein LOC126702151 n=1 Tax=Quercus robur TaxID=38942 RepID=UPI0021620372|nr:uncharacterized protein LOC126702151 [Quercus robur]